MPNPRAHLRALQTLICLSAVASFLPACKFSPEISSGWLSCAGAQRCPDGLVCRPATGKCCQPEDRSTACSGAGSGLADAGATPPDDAATPLAADAGPAGAGPTRLLEGAFKLIDFERACTGARADANIERWCGFYRGTELWVLNIGRAGVLGQARCDGSDPGCLRLTTSAFRSDVAQVYWRPGFEGDLLIYQADPRQRAGQDFRGNVYGWRPGWTAGRPLSSPNGLFCQANELDGSSVACFEQVDDTHADLRGGRLPVDEKTPLPRIAGGTLGTSAIQTTYSGDYLVYSSAADGQLPSLYAVPAGQVSDPGTRVLIANDARLLAVGANGTKVFFLRGANSTKTNAVGTLMRVDLPTGKNPVEMARAIENAATVHVRDASDIVYAHEGVDSNLEAVHRVFPDVAVPTRSIVVGRSNVDAFALSNDAKFAYTQARDANSGKDIGRVFDLTTEIACELGPVPSTTDTNGVPLPAIDRFSADGTRVYWRKLVSTPESIETWMANSADCKPIRLLGVRADLPWDLGSRGLVFQEDWSSANGGALRFVKFDAKGQILPAVRILDATDRNFAVIRGETGAVVVFTSGAPSREGIYFTRVLSD
jgi:hypothetical protein